MLFCNRSMQNMWILLDDQCVELIVGALPDIVGALPDIVEAFVPYRTL